MKKINKKSKVKVEEKAINGAAGKSLKLSTKDIAFEGLKVGRKIFRKLHDLEELVEMIAREIKRQLERQHEPS